MAYRKHDLRPAGDLLPPPAPRRMRLGGSLGIAVLAALAFALHVEFLGHLSIAIPALGLGALATLLPGGARLRESGQRTYSIWLQTGAVLLGAAIDPGAIAAMGLRGALLVLLKILLAYLGARLVLRRILPPVTARLLGIGNAVCGVSAIMLAKERLGASDAEAMAAAGSVLVVGTLAVFLAPLVALGLHPAPYVAGAICGLGVDNTAEAIASGSAFGAQGLQMATMVKLTRNALLGVVVALSGREARSLREVVRDVPPFVAGYALLAALRLSGVLGAAPALWAGRLSDVAFALAFVGVGAMLRDEVSGGQLRHVARGTLYLLGTLALSAVMVLLVGP